MYLMRGSWADVCTLWAMIQVVIQSVEFTYKATFLEHIATFFSFTVSQQGHSEKVFCWNFKLQLKQCLVLQHRFQDPIHQHCVSKITGTFVSLSLLAMLRMTLPFCRWIHLQQQQNKQWSNSSEYYISLKKLLMEITDEKSLLRHCLHWEIEVSSLVISNQFAIWLYMSWKLSMETRETINAEKCNKLVWRWQTGDLCTLQSKWGNHTFCFLLIPWHQTATLY